MSTSRDELILRGAISKMTREEQDKIFAVAETIRRIVKSNGDFGVIAIGLVAMEVAVEQEG
jgi:hypothetical protein